MVTATETPAAEVATTSTGGTARPTAPIVIGGTEYVALCPKMAVWITAVHQVNEAVAQAGGNAMAAAKTLHDVLVGDDADPHSVGILVQALEPEDIAALVARLRDRRDELDMDELWYAAIALLTEFEGWVQQRGKEMGINIPKLVPQAKRKQPVRQARTVVRR